MRPCCYAFQGMACNLSSYGPFTEKTPALPGDAYYACFSLNSKISAFFLLLESSTYSQVICNKYEYLSVCRRHTRQQ